ncbi:SDR family oxidoreductase [Paraburkholderia sacchari]|nr:SDR family oxidoreductase [Paraburkholderia sacchari]
MAKYPDLTGKVALVTGAASGIGRATAEAFVRAGAHVVLADVSRQAGQSLAEELGRQGGKASFVSVDVSDPEQCHAMVAEIRNTIGRLDIAFNNAGVADNDNPPPSHEVGVAQWKRIIDIDLSGVFYCIQAEIPLMLENGGGVIINTASLQSFISFPRTAAYTAAKHGVLGITRAIATEYGRQGIRCNAVAPGIVATEMTRTILDAPQWRTSLEQQIPLGRVAQPVDIARAVIWLSAEDAQYVNGACLPIDGGFLV